MIDFDRSYARKVFRSKKHLDEIESELARYEGRHPYIAVRDRKTNPNPRIWTYRAHLEEQPSPDLALMVGDAIHNLRSALDYVVAELVPPNRRRKCKFPVIRTDILATDPESGEYLDGREGAENERTQLESALRGMDPDAAGFIYSVQPGKAPYDAESHPLAVLSALDDADKHSELVTLARGIKDPVTTLRYGDEFSITIEGTPGDIVEEGGVVAQFIIRPRDLKAYVNDQSLVDRIIEVLADGKAEVDVEVIGTPQVAIQVRGAGRLAPLPSAIHELGTFVWSDVLTTLDHFVQLKEAGAAPTG